MPRKPVEMSAAWRLRFHRELTDSVLARVRGYADKLSYAYLHIEGIADERYAHDLVNQAVLDTMQGIRTWDPDREPPPGGLPLYRHLCRVVYSRVYHDRLRRRRQRTVSFHNVDLDDENSVEVSMSLRRDDERKRPEGQVVLAELRAKLYAPLRALAVGDPEVLQYLDLLEGGIIDEPEIRRRAQWDENTFNRVHRRWKTIRRKLPPEIVDDVRDAIVRAPIYTGDDWRKPKGTEVGAHDDDEGELEDAPDADEDECDLSVDQEEAS